LFLISETPLFGEIAREVEFSAERHGCSVLIANSRGEWQREINQIHSMLERSVRGLIVVACSDKKHDSLEDVSTPIISLDRRLGSYPLASIDNRRMSAKLGEHIADCGHLSVAYISGPNSTQIARDRLTGFEEGFRRRAPKNCRIEVSEGTFSFEAGEQLATEFLSRDDRPTAIVGANDQIAIGALRAARDLNISVPAQLSVAGFDNIILAPLVVPSLTTIAQPTGQLAASVVDRLLGDRKESTDIVANSELIVRDSTARISI